MSPPTAALRRALHPRLPARRARRPRVRACALAVALAAAGLAGVPACRGGDERAGGPPPPPAVGVTVARLAPVRDDVELVGELRAREAVDLRPEIDGVVVEITFREGDPVSAGDVLVRLRDGEQRARLHEAEARLALARDEFARTRRLARRNAAAAAELERARAEVEMALARVELAQVELERTRVRAPFDGFAGARQVSPGARVTPETPLVRVVAVDPLEAVFTIPERALTAVRAGLEVAVRVAPYPEEDFPGQVFFVSPDVDPRTRRLLMKARVENPDRRLRPGLFARVMVVLGEREALVVPEEAVVYDRTGPFVWRLGPEDVAERAPVALGVQEPGRVEIRRGLEPGDRIVSSGTHKVYAGLRVRAVPEPAAPGGVAPADAAPAPAGVAAGEESGVPRTGPAGGGGA